MTPYPETYVNLRANRCWRTRHDSTIIPEYALTGKKAERLVVVFNFYEDRQATCSQFVMQRSTPNGFNCLATL